MSDEPENTGSEVVRAPDGRWKPGAGSPNAGGRPRKLREIETMLDEEHRTVENMRPVFACATNRDPVERTPDGRA